MHSFVCLTACAHAHVLHLILRVPFMFARHFTPFSPLFCLCISLSYSYSHAHFPVMKKNIMHGWMGRVGEGGRDAAKILSIRQKINVYSLLSAFYVLSLPFPSLHIPQSSHIASVWPADTNDRAFCHGVWDTLNITCQLRDNNGWQGAEGTQAKRDVLLQPTSVFV